MYTFFIRRCPGGLWALGGSTLARLFPPPTYQTFFISIRSAQLALERGAPSLSVQPAQVVNRTQHQQKQWTERRPSHVLQTAPEGRKTAQQPAYVPYTLRHFWKEDNNSKLPTPTGNLPRFLFLCQREFPSQLCLILSGDDLAGPTHTGDLPVGRRRMSARGKSILCTDAPFCFSITE